MPSGSFFSAGFGVSSMVPTRVFQGFYRRFHRGFRVEDEFGDLSGLRVRIPRG